MSQPRRKLGAVISRLVIDEDMVVIAQQPLDYFLKISAPARGNGWGRIVGRGCFDDEIGMGTDYSQNLIQVCVLSVKGDPLGVKLKA